MITTILITVFAVAAIAGAVLITFTDRIRLVLACAAVSVAFFVMALISEAWTS